MQLRILDKLYREEAGKEKERLGREPDEEELRALGKRVCEERIRDFGERYEKVKGLDFGEYLEKKLDFSACVREYVREGQETDGSFYWMDGETVESLSRFSATRRIRISAAIIPWGSAWQATGNRRFIPGSCISRSTDG